MSSYGLASMYPSPVGARLRIYALVPGPSQHVCLTASWRMLPIGSARYPLRSDSLNIHLNDPVSSRFQPFFAFVGRLLTAYCIYKDAPAELTGVRPFVAKLAAFLEGTMVAWRVADGTQRAS